ncbi:MAG: hypothetical protein JO180_04825 [Gemmatirosa sp.]|nr:hypothetical protein [Gemmatirosa sp.]
MPTASNAALPTETWSEVRAHDHVTRYRRAGSGRAVVVLDADGADPLWPELAGGIAERFRLIVPEVPPADVDQALWLAEFLEGLGTSTVALVATGRLCVPALELTLRDPDQVARLVLVPGGAAVDATIGATIGGALAAPASRSVPLLVARRGLPADEALPLIARFLADASTAAGATSEVATVG